MTIFRSARRADKVPLVAPVARTELLRNVRWELVPLKSIEPAIASLPPGSSVSVSCSPTKGIDATLDIVGRLLDEGHDAVPHLAARMVEGPEHLARITAWCQRHRPRELFVIAGDSEQPLGPFDDSTLLLRELLDRRAATGYGIAGYPDGHPLIPSAAQREALQAKQTLFHQAGVTGSISTQMCFDTARVNEWINTIRAQGIELPVRFGLPGVVDRAKLLTLGTRLGIGASLRFLRKNRAAVGHLVGPGGYDPTSLVDGVALRPTNSTSPDCTCSPSTRWRNHSRGAPDSAASSPASAPRSAQDGSRRQGLVRAASRNFRDRSSAPCGGPSTSPDRRHGRRPARRRRPTRP